MVDFPGHLAALLFTSGCNFTCGFCHNAALLGDWRDGVSWERLAEACAEFRANWVDGAVVTGGEPTLHPELGELLRFLRGHGFAVKLDTNGSRPQELEKALEHVQFVAMDVKCSLQRYPEFVGCADPGLVRESIRILIAADVPCEFRTTVIHGVHSDEEILDIAAMIRGAEQFALQAFLPRDDLPDPALRRLGRTSVERLEHLAELVRPFVGKVVVRGS